MSKKGVMLAIEEANAAPCPANCRLSLSKG